MKTDLIKLTTVVAMLLLISLSPAWSAEVQSMPGGGMGGGGNATTTMMGGGDGHTTTIPGGGGYTTTTMMGGGGMGGHTTTTITDGGGNITTSIIGGGGGMMGGIGRMGQFVIADLDNDNVPEIITIVSGRTLVIMDNEGNVISSKLLPTIPGLTNERITASGLQVADMDGDNIPEIVTTYYVTNYFNMMFRSGESTTNGTYLVILDNQGNLENYKQLQIPYLPY